MDQNEITDTLNDLMIAHIVKRNGGSVPWMLHETWWEPIGGNCFRLKNYKTLEVVGSITRFITFGGFRWEARRNKDGHKEFATANEASLWVAE